MGMVLTAEVDLTKLQEIFGDRLQEQVSLKRYTAARLGGMADHLLTVESAGELSQAASTCWEQGIPFLILGSGSNVLVSDRGARQLVILNQAKHVTFNPDTQPLSVSAESGTNFGALARQAATRGLSGLEWAAGIPGTVGGAVYGNAGAHGSDMSTCLIVADILQLTHTKEAVQPEILRVDWPVENFDYGYRTSSLKRLPGSHLVLAATIKLNQSTPEAVQAKMDEYRLMRQSSQPSGASLGSIFKNPVGEHAGRLIEAAGLKGRQVGRVEVSQVHANFFVNRGEASANDYAALIRLVQQEVFEKFGINLELEIEMIGDWSQAER
jgi:UDP-N-acetylmuramate dehydrogenase